jgi:hypothetical protein
MHPFDGVQFDGGGALLIVPIDLCCNQYDLESSILGDV